VVGDKHKTCFVSLFPPTDTQLKRHPEMCSMLEGLPVAVIFWIAAAMLMVSGLLGLGLINIALGFAVLTVTHNRNRR
jgi:hypothetical protein